MGLAGSLGTLGGNPPVLGRQCNEPASRATALDVRSQRPLSRLSWPTRRLPGSWAQVARRSGGAVRERGAQSRRARNAPVVPAPSAGPTRAGGNPWQVIAIIALIAATAGWTTVAVIALREPSTAAVASSEPTDPAASDDSSIPPAVAIHEVPELEAPRAARGQWDGTGDAELERRRDPDRRCLEHRVDGVPHPQSARRVPTSSSPRPLTPTGRSMRPSGCIASSARRGRRCATHWSRPGRPTPRT